jgi:hypothetical protein
MNSGEPWPWPEEVTGPWPEEVARPWLWPEEVARPPIDEQVPAADDAGRSCR